MDQIAGPAVAISPERAFGTDGSLVIDAFFVGATDDLLWHHYAENAELIEECDRLFNDLNGVADITVFAVPLMHLRGLAAFILDDCRDQL